MLMKMGQAETFMGYGPYRGYDFLIDEIIKHDYQARGIKLDNEEVFVSEGAKPDSGNISRKYSAQTTL